MPRRVDWRGDEVLERVIKACRFAIDKTHSEAEDLSKTKVPVVTATLQGSLRLEPAEHRGNAVVGRFGSFDVNYALGIETGDRSKIPPGALTPPIGPPVGRRNTGNGDTSCGMLRRRSTRNSSGGSLSITGVWANVF